MVGVGLLGWLDCNETPMGDWIKSIELEAFLFHADRQLKHALRVAQ